MKKRYHKTKSYETTTSDNVLAYRLLKAANLLTCDKQLVKHTIIELKYDSVKSKLIKIFSENCEVPISEFNDIHVKTEPVYHTQSYPEYDTFNHSNYEKKDLEFQLEYIYENDNEWQNEHLTLYTHNNKHPVRTKGNQSYQQPFQRRKYQQPTAINNITNNKIINNQTINDHNH